MMPLYQDDEALRAAIAPHLSRAAFVRAIGELERYGFPKADPLFKGRYAPAVRAWLDKQAGLRKIEAQAPDGEETWDDAGTQPDAGPHRSETKERARSAVLVRRQPLDEGQGISGSLDPFTSRRHGAGDRDLCEVYTARLFAWRDRGPAPRFLYDGTIGSLCDCFERHPESPIHDVQRSTAEAYADSLKVIRATVARRAVRALTPIDVKAWYRKWRAPAEDGKPERVKRGHYAVSALRMILGFGLALGFEECGALALGLAKNSI
jgi:hypothetical protein